MISPVWFELESRLLCGSIGMFFVCLMPVICFSRNVLRAVLSKCLAFVLRLSCVPVEMSCVRSRLLFAACAPNRTACGMFRSYSAVGRDRHSRVLGCRVVIGLCWFTSGLCVSLWRSRRRTKGTGERGERRERRTESAARQSAFLRDRIGFVMFSAGSPLGRNVEAALRPRPRLRQRAIGSLDSLHLGRNVGVFHAAKGTRV